MPVTPTKDLDEYPAMLSRQDLEEFLNISNCTSLKLIHQPGFPAVRVGKKLFRIPRKALQEWLEKGAGEQPA